MSDRILDEGLIDSVDIYSRSETTEYGAIVVSESLILSGYKCRLTFAPGIKSGPAFEMMELGGESDEYWYWIGEYNVLLDEDQIIKTTDGENFKILRVVNKRDAEGVVHHLRIKSKLLDENG